MEVTVEVVEGLQRRMTVTIAENNIESQVEQKLRSVAKTARMQGFRPGKVPFKMIKKQYLGQVEAEVMSDLIQSSYGEALGKEEIKPAGSPSLESQELKDDNVFEYAVTFEVYPEVEVQGLDKIAIEKPKVEISDANIDQMIDTLRKQRVTWSEVDRESQDGDQMVISFEGKIDGEAFEGGATEKMPLVLGEGRMLPDFESNMPGLKAGDEKTFELTFPEDYQGKEVAGKTAEFSVKVDSVSEPVLPEIDDEFLKEYGVDEGGVEKFREDIRENMQRELDQTVRSKIKNQVMDGLIEQNPIDVPNALVVDEVSRLRESTKEDMKRSGQNAEFDLPSSIFEEQARRRVQLGLLVAELIQSNEIELDKEKFEEEVKTIASTYEQAEMVEQAYRERPELRQGLEAVVMENQLVDTLLD